MLSTDPEMFDYFSTERDRHEQQERIREKLLNRGFKFSDDPLKDLLVAQSIIYPEVGTWHLQPEASPEDLLIVEGFRRRAILGTKATN